MTYLSLVTNNVTEYAATIKFYKQLGFRTVKSYVKEAHKHSDGITCDSIKEAWMESFDFANNKANISGENGKESNKNGKEGSQSEDKQAFVSKISSSTAIKLRYVKSTCDFHPLRIEMSSDVDKVATLLGIEPSGGIVETHDPMGNTIVFVARAPMVPVVPEVAAVTTSNAKKIAVMTSGGDSAGMNAVVRSVVRSGIHFGCDVYAIYDGYDGLVTGGSMIRQMQWDDVRGFLSIGGTLIGTARNKEFRLRSGRLKAAYNLVSAGVDALVVCGGDGSLTGADLFRSDWPSLMKELVSTGKLAPEVAEKYPKLSIVGLVGSIDNDMAMTDRTIGAFTALGRIVEMVDCIDATATSHSRAFVIEVMGRHCGWLALMAGISSGADYVFIPERPENAKTWPATLQKICERHRSKGHRKTTVIVAEGAIDNELNPIKSDQVKDVLVEMGLDTRVTKLGHVQRGGPACAYDRMLASIQGFEAIKTILADDGKSPAAMIGINNGKIVRRSLVDAVALTKSVAAAIEAKDFDKAMSLRDSEFAECYHNFVESTYHDDGSHKVSESKRLTIGVVHVGAPTSALNAVTRALGLYSFSRGHRLLAIENGFSGLIRHGTVTELAYEDVGDWYNLGGSVIGTNRSLPSQDLGTVAYYFQKYKFDGVVVIGGYEAFKAVQQLQSARDQYPVFNMPLVAIPSTVSNNVPGSQYSLGSDTCMNELVSYCDAIKQSASASRRRVFVIEVQGGFCGYIAAYVSLITGALASYIPENKITLSQIRKDVEILKQAFQNDKGQNRNGKIVILNEKASKVFTADLLTRIMDEQSGGRFKARCSIPGHVQQGNYPSSLDRVSASRLGVKACEFIEQWSWKVDDDRAAFKDMSDPKLRFRYIKGVKHNTVSVLSDSVCVASVSGSHIAFVPVKKLVEEGLVDEEKRIFKDEFWGEYMMVNEVLSGRLQ